MPVLRIWYNSTHPRTDSASPDRPRTRTSGVDRKQFRSVRPRPSRSSSSRSSQLCPSVAVVSGWDAPREQWRADYRALTLPQRYKKAWVRPASLKPGQNPNFKSTHTVPTSPVDSRTLTLRWRQFANGSSTPTSTSRKEPKKRCEKRSSKSRRGMSPYHLRKRKQRRF